jgi:excisionase family DNA binding protein
MRRPPGRTDVVSVMAADPNARPTDAFHIPPREPSARVVALRASRLAGPRPVRAHSREFGAETSAPVEDAMTKQMYADPVDTRSDVQVAAAAVPPDSGLPNRLMTAREVAAFVGCHEETVRRASWRGLLVSQRFGVRRRRFHPRDVLDWIRRGAPTRVS